MPPLSTNPPPSVGRLVLERLAISDGYMKNAELRFAEQLNSFLGTRGTGKTTLFMCIAYVLEVPLTPKQLGLVKTNLAGGRIRLSVRVAHGARYVLARSFGQERTAVFNENDQPVKVSVRGNPLFAVDFYGHDQIGDIADEPEEQLALLDRLVGSGMESVQREIAESLRALDENASLLLEVQSRRDLLESQAAEAKDLARQLEPMLDAGAADNGAMKLAHTARLLRDRERRAVTRARDAVKKVRRTVHDAVAGARSELAGWAESDLTSGPNAAVIGAIDAQLRAMMGGIEALATGADTLGRDTEAVVAREDEALSLLHAKQEQVYSALVAAQNEEASRAVERIQLQERYSVVMTAPQRLEHSQREWQQLRGQRRPLLAALANQRGQRSMLRHDKTTRISEALDSEVRIILLEDEERSAYQAAIADGLKGSVSTHLATAKILAKLPPETLTAMIEGRDTAALMLQTGIRPDQANAIFDALGRWPTLFAIEAARIDDVARIELMDQGEWQSVTEVSQGQRSTAILPIIMVEGSRPLLIDQPEDDLDNQFIYERVVKLGLLRAKHRIQIILATHSANIAVLGESEHLFVVTKQGRKLGKASQAANLDDALRILEGGREAMLARVNRYGLSEALAKKDADPSAR